MLETVARPVVEKAAEDGEENAAAPEGSTANRTV